MLPSTDEPTKEPAVAPTWWIALFTAALRRDTNSQTRNRVGSWVIARACRSQRGVTSPEMIVLCSAYSHFLTTSFLPWATQGHLFSKSLRRCREKVWCEHGDSLLGFFEQLWADCGSSTSLRLYYLESCLNWLYQTGKRVCVHAQWYILCGLKRARGEIDCPPEIAHLALSISQQSHRSNIQQLRIAQACQSLCGPPQRVPEWYRLEEAVANLSKELDNDLCDWPSSHPIISSLYTDRSILGGGRLRSACKAFLDVLDSGALEQGFDTPDVLLKALEVTWSECKMQDFPRPILVLLPKLLFHHCLLARADQDPQLQAFLSSKLKTLQFMTHARIYLWNPLAFAIRTAIWDTLEEIGPMDAPKIVHQHLDKPSRILYLELNTFINQFINSLPSPRPEYLLDSAIETKTIGESTKTGADHDTARYCQANESLGHASIFDMIIKLGSAASWNSSSLLALIVKPWLHQTQPVSMVSKWKTTAQMQAMVILTESISTASFELATLEGYRNNFMEILAVEPLPRYRFLLEWIVVAWTYRMIELGVYSEQNCNILAELCTSSDQASPKYLCSLMKLAVAVCKHPSTEVEYAVRLYKHLVALSASQKVSVRLDAQWNVSILWQHAESRNWTAITRDEMLGSLCAFIKGLEKFRNPPTTRFLVDFEPLIERTLTTLFEGPYLKLDPPETSLVTSQDFEWIWSRDRSSGAAATAVLPLGSSKPDKGDDYPSAHSLVSLDNASEPDSVSDSDVSTFQTKSRDKRDPVCFSNGLSASDGKQWQPTSSLGHAGPRIVLIASLLETPLNLGGICRVSDIFGVQCLHLPSLEVVKSPQFQTTSVRSHGHVNMVGTPAQQLRDVLREHKRLGYTVVGIEQTSTSFILGAEEGKGGKRLPERAVFVLGTERTGIPAEILAELDDSVEISQWGVTRSLNVQTAAAVVLWEWRREWSS